MTDFGADVSFSKAMQKVEEHYQIKVPECAVRRATLKHGEAMQRAVSLESELPDKGVKQIIAESDGSMIPLVEVKTGPQIKDSRKTRKVRWKEVRLCFARDYEKVDPVYGATKVGGLPEEAGSQLLHCAIKAGAGLNTNIHALGDGATWIRDQFFLVFGTMVTFLVDFFHVCEYLAAASHACAKKPNAWLTRQKNKLKKNQINKVIKALNPFAEDDSVSGDKAPVQAAIRYISNRTDQMDYNNAITNQLPVGTGEIESGHRHVIQARVKLSGAWWKMENADKMIALRITRVNQHWENYWNTVAA